MDHKRRRSAARGATRRTLFPHADNRVPGVTGGSATIAPWPEHAAVLALPCAGQLVPEASALSDQDDLNPHEIAEAVEAFALGLPLGSGRAAAEVEAAVSRRLLDAEVSRSQLRQRLRKWMQVAQELQQLVERQQDELKVAEACCDDVRRHQQSQDPELEATNCELRSQLSSARTQLRELENALNKAMARQAAGRDLDAARLQQERDAARQQLAERSAALSASSDEVARLRRALLDAEIDTQRSSVAAEGAAAKLKDSEAGIARLRCQLAALNADLDAERTRARAATDLAQARAAEAADARARVSAMEAEAAAVRRSCPGCAERDGRIEAFKEAAEQHGGHVAALEASLNEERRHGQSLSASLQEAQGRLTSALAASEALQQQKRELVAQLYGSEDTPSISSAAAGCLPNHPASPSLDGRVPLAGEGLFQRVQRLAAALARSEAAAAEAGLALEYARQEVAEVRAAQRAAVDKAAALEREVGLLRQRTEAAESDARAAISRADDAAATADRRAAEMTAGTAQIDQLRARITGLESECATALAQASAYAAEHEQADAAVAALRAQLSQLQKANAALQEKVNRGTAQLAAARVKMEEVLSAARREGEERLAAAAAEHQDAIEKLARSYDERIDALRHELAADATRRVDADARVAALKAQHAAALEAAQSVARDAQAKLDLARAQVAQLQQAAAAAEEKRAAAEAAVENSQQAAATEATSSKSALAAAHQQLADARVEHMRLKEEAAAAQRTAASAQAEAAAAQRSLRELQASACDDAARAAGQLAEARAAQERAVREVAALQERLMELEQGQREEEYVSMQQHQAVTFAAWGSPGSLGSLSPGRLRHGGVRSQALQRSSGALSELLAAREGEVSLLMAELGSLRAENDELLVRLRQAGRAAPAGLAEASTPRVRQEEVQRAEALLRDALADKARLTVRARDLEQRLAEARQQQREWEQELQRQQQQIQQLQRQRQEQDAPGDANKEDCGEDGGSSPPPQPTAQQLRLHLRQVSAQLAETEAAAEREGAALRKQVALLQQQLNEACSATAAAELRLDTASKAKAAAEWQLEKQGQRVVALEDQLAEAKYQAGEQEREREAHARARAASVAAEGEVSVLRHELQYLQHQFEQVVEEATRKDEELAAARVAAAAAAAEYAEKLAAAKAEGEMSARDQLAALQQQVEEARAAEARARAEVEALSQRVAELEQRLREQKERWEMQQADLKQEDERRRQQWQEQLKRQEQQESERRQLEEQKQLLQEQQQQQQQQPGPPIPPQLRQQQSQKQPDQQLRSGAALQPGAEGEAVSAGMRQLHALVSAKDRHLQKAQQQLEELKARIAADAAGVAASNCQPASHAGVQPASMQQAPTAQAPVPASPAPAARPDAGMVERLLKLQASSARMGDAEDPSSSHLRRAMSQSDAHHSSSGSRRASTESAGGEAGSRTVSRAKSLALRAGSSSAAGSGGVRDLSAWRGPSTGAGSSGKGSEGDGVEGRGSRGDEGQGYSQGEPGALPRRSLSSGRGWVSIGSDRGGSGSASRAMRIAGAASLERPGAEAIRRRSSSVGGGGASNGEGGSRRQSGIISSSSEDELDARHDPFNSSVGAAAIRSRSSGLNSPMRRTHSGSVGGRGFSQQGSLPRIRSSEGGHALDVASGGGGSKPPSRSPSRAASMALSGGYDAEALRKSLSLRSMPAQEGLTSRSEKPRVIERSSSVTGANAPPTKPSRQQSASINGRGIAPSGSFGAASRSPGAAVAALAAAAAVAGPRLRQTVSFTEPGERVMDREVAPVRRSLTASHARAMQRVKGMMSSGSDSD